MKKLIQKVRLLSFKFLYNLTERALFHNVYLGVLIGRLLQVLSANKYKTLAIKYFDKQEGRHTIQPKKKGYVILPEENTVPSKKIDKDVCEIGYNYIEEAVIVSDSGLVVTSDGIYRQRFSAIRSYEKVNNRNSLILQTSTNYGLVQLVSESTFMDKGVFIGGNWPHNWYHWMIEILSKVVLYDQIDDKYKDYPILISDMVEKSKNHLDVFQILFPNAEFKVLNKGAFYNIKELIFLDSLTPTFHDHKTAWTYEPLDYNFYWGLMNEFRSRLLSRFGSNKKETPKRIYLSRKRKGRGFNEEELLERIEEFGFTKIYLEDRSLQDQYTLFNQAEIIMGPTGASWTNIMFCQSHAKGLLWAPDNARGAVTYSNLAELSKMKLVHYYYPTQAEDWKKYILADEDVKLNVEEMRNIIQGFIEE